MIIDHPIHKYLIKNQFYRHTLLMSAGQRHQNFVLLMALSHEKKHYLYDISVCQLTGQHASTVSHRV